MDAGSVSAIAVLDDPVRAALFHFVRNADRPVTREAAAEAAGVSRKLAAFHLDKLVAAGLLASHLPSGAGRVGRAPRLYQPSGTDVAVSLPERAHGLLAEILVAAIVEADEHAGAPVREGVLRTARAYGEQLGAAERDRLRPGRVGAERALALTAALLDEHGFRPVRDGTAVRLRNCPFHPMAERSPQLVCSLNHAFLAGVLTGLGADSALAAVLMPRPGECCVQLRSRSTIGTCSSRSPRSPSPPS